MSLGKEILVSTESIQRQALLLCVLAGMTMTAMGARAQEATAPSMRLTTRLDPRIGRALWVRFGALGPWSAGARRKREMQTLGRAGVRELYLDPRSGELPVLGGDERA